MTMIEFPVALSSNKVTISGGTVTALQGGITGQYFSTGENGNAVVIASNINMSKQCSMDNGLFILPKGGGIRGNNSSTLTQNVTIPAGYTLAINDGQTLNIAGGVTLTNRYSRRNLPDRLRNTGRKRYFFIECAHRHANRYSHYFDL